MENRALAGIMMWVLLAAGCETPLPVLLPSVEEPAAAPPVSEAKTKTSDTRRLTTSAVSEFGVPSNLLEIELARCKEALAAAERRVAALEGELNKEKDALAAAERRVAALEGQLDKEREAIAAAMSKGSTMQEALEQSQRRIADLERQIAQSHETETRLQADLLAVQTSMAELQQNTRRDVRRAEDLQLQAQESERELSRRKAALADTTRHLTELEQDKQKVAQSLAQAQARLDVLAADLAAEQGKNAMLQAANLRLTESLDSLKQSLENEIEKRDILIKKSRGQLVITMLDRLLFDSGQTTIKPTALKTLNEVSKMLKQISDKEIRVEGHTDDRPIRGSLAQRYPTNWELSTARATSVVRYLVDQAGVDAAKISAGGYAHTRPVASNDTDEGRSQNRRIEIVLYAKDLVTVPESQPSGTTSPSASKPD
jgi:chemotaxis protein MotB